MNSQAVTLLKSELNKTGGLEKYTWQIAKAFCQRLCPVTLLTTGRVTPPFSDPYLQVHSFPIDYPLSYLNVARFNSSCQAFLKQNPTPLVFGLDRNSFQTHIRAGNGVHAAFLNHRRGTEGAFKSLTFSCNPLHRLLLQIEKTSFEDPDLHKLFTNSHLVKQEILQHYDTDPQKIQVIHNGVEWTQMQSPFDAWEEERLGMIHSLGLDPHSYQILFIGHNFRRKGLEPLLQGLSLLKDTSIQLSVIGKDKNSAYFQQKVQQLNLTKQVHFLGARTDIYRFYQMADSLAIPSAYDPFANVTVEALAMGLFVLSSKTNGGHEVLQPFSGATLNDLDPSSIAQGLQTALNFPKTPLSAQLIRSSVEYLDFPNQLNEITSACLN